jgi:hypothetical protein
MLGLNNWLAWLSLFVFVSLIVVVRHIKMTIYKLRTEKNDIEYKIENIVLFEVLKLNSYTEEITLLVFLGISIGTSQIYYKTPFLGLLLFFSLLYFSFIFIRTKFLKSMIEQPYFDKNELFEIEESSLINEEVEEKLKKYKLVGKENSIARKNEVLKFVKTKTTNIQLKNEILFFYFYLFFGIQIILLISGIIFWSMKYFK